MARVLLESLEAYYIIASSPGSPRLIYCMTFKVLAPVPQCVVGHVVVRHADSERNIVVSRNKSSTASLLL